MLTNTSARGAEPFKVGTSWAKRGAVAATEEEGFAPRVERERKSHKKVVQARRVLLVTRKTWISESG